MLSSILYNLAWWSEASTNAIVVLEEALKKYAKVGVGMEKEKKTEEIAVGMEEIEGEREN